MGPPVKPEGDGGQERAAGEVRGAKGAGRMPAPVGYFSVPGKRRLVAITS
jgi:hypothetical protein